MNARTYSHTRVKEEAEEKVSRVSVGRLCTQNALLRGFPLWVLYGLFPFAFFSRFLFGVERTGVVVTRNQVCLALTFCLFHSQFLAAGSEGRRS